MKKSLQDCILSSTITPWSSKRRRGCGVNIWRSRGCSVTFSGFPKTILFAPFERWWTKHSRSLRLVSSSCTRTPIGVPLYVFPHLARAVGPAAHARFSLPVDEAFRKEMIVWHFLGMMQGLYRARQASRRQVETR